MYEGYSKKIKNMKDLKIAIKIETINIKNETL